MFKVRTCQKLSKAEDIRHNQILQYLGYAFTVMLTSIKRFKAIACNERKGHLPILRSRWKISVKCAQHCSLLMLSVWCCSFPVYIKECKYYSPHSTSTNVLFRKITYHIMYTPQYDVATSKALNEIGISILGAVQK